MSDLSQGIGGFRFTKYQLDYLADGSPRIITNKARRIGMTEVAAFKRAQRAAGIVLLPGRPFERARPVPQNIFSAGKAQAKAALARVVKWLRVLEVAFGKQLIKDDGLEVVRMRSGVEVRAFSSSSRTFRGFEGDILLDEFAYVPKEREVWKAVSPAAGRNLRNPHGYQIEIISTPNGDDDLFHELCTHPKHAERFSRHEIGLPSAIADGFRVLSDEGVALTAEDIRIDVGDDDLYAQEYLCSFLASSQRYIPREVWEAACYDPERERPEGVDGGVFGGMDVAAGGHESVIVDLERTGDVLYQLATADRRRIVDWDAQEAWAAAGMTRRRRFAIDATGPGSQFGQRFEHRFEGVAEAVKFTLQSKEAIATGLKLALSRKKLRPLASDPDLMRDVLMIRRIVTEAGNVRYDAAQTQEGGAKRHADGAWALALAVYAAGGAAAEPVTRTRIAAPPSSGIAGPRARRGAMWR